MNAKITDVLIITKKFRSPNEFGMFIDERVSKTKLTYMEAVIQYCKDMDIEIDSISSLINQKLKDKIRLEAEQANMLKSKGRLPV